MKGFFASALFAGLVSASVANAATVTGVYYGVLTDSDHPAFPYLSVGDRYRIGFSYDTSVPDDVPQPDFGEYLGTLSANIAFSNGFRFKISGGAITVGNGTEDFVQFSSEAGTVTTPGVSIDPYLLEGIGWGGSNFDGTLLSSDHLPGSYLSTALFDDAGLGITFVGPGREFISLSGTLTSTPLPPAFPLFAAAIGSLCLVGWHRHMSTRDGVRL